MFALTNLHRYEPLTESTLPHAFDVLWTVFTPDALAQQVTCRLAQLIDCGAVRGANLAITLDRHRTRTATTVGVFVDDHTRAQFQVIPLEQFDEWLVNDVLHVHGGVLTRQEIGRENAAAGLHLLILCFKAQDRDISETDRMVIVQEMMSGLFPEYLGYNLKSFTGRIRHTAQVFSGIQAGCRLLRPGTMPMFVEPAADDLLPHPVLIATDRDTVEFAAWVSSAFVSRRPRLRFTTAEQRILALAVRGYRDSEIASSCSVSGSTANGRGFAAGIAQIVMSGQQPTRARLPVAIAVVAALSSYECARSLRYPLQPPVSSNMLGHLWRMPNHLENRDLFHGPGGSALVPPAVTYAFVARKTTGTNPGYDVRDPGGKLWSVKLGDESQSEVTASRILWAIGFHQPPTYYVDRWTLSGADMAEQPAGRFRTEFPGHEVAGDWSWYDNPFIGSRPFGALVTVNVLLNNWDFKTTNNKIYVVTSGDGRKEPRYVVRDLGASFGKARQPRFLSWFPFMRYKQGSKNTVEDFEAQGFVKGFQGENVQFDYRGIDDALVNSPTIADLRWTGELLSRLSDRQWRDAFRAGGYTPDQSERYVRKIKEKIAQAVAQPQ